MLYNTKKKTFVLTKETINEFEEREEALILEDIRNNVYSTEEINMYIREENFQKILKKAKSLTVKTMLFQYSNYENLSILEAIARNKEERINIYQKAIKSFGIISVNNKGGYSPATEEDIKESIEYSFGLENITDNNTKNLIIENDEKVSFEFSEIKNPSVITNYKHIFLEKVVDNFIRSRKDWNLWIYTQGMDMNLYRKFLTIYGEFIEVINVKTESNSVLTLSKEFPEISFNLI
jgi:hypothetical protein